MLEKLLLELGYGEVDITLLKYNKSLNGYSEIELCDNIKKIFDYLLSLGYSRDEVLKITSLNSMIYSKSILDIENRYIYLSKLGYSDEEIKKLILGNGMLLVVLEDEINNSLKIMNKLNYTNDDIRLMSLKHSAILSSSKVLEKRYNEIMDLGYEATNVNDITKKDPCLLFYKFDGFKDKINYLKELGFPFSTILKLSRDCDYFNLILVDDLKTYVRDLRLLGFNLFDIHNMVLVYPMIFLLPISNVIEKIEYMITMGYTYSSSLRILSENALIFSQSKNLIKMRIDLFKEFDYSFIDISNMTLLMPKIYDIPLDELVLKLEFFRISKLSNIIIDNPKYLMDDIVIMYSRYIYLTSRGIKINSKNYELLFINNDDFNKKYDVDYEEVSNNYDKSKLINSYVKRKFNK